MKAAEELKREWIIGRTQILSDMLNNPDEYGIYPTTKCFNALDELHKELLNEYARQVSRDIAIKFVNHLKSDEMTGDLTEEYSKVFDEWKSK